MPAPGAVRMTARFAVGERLRALRFVLTVATAALLTAGPAAEARIELGVQDDPLLVRSPSAYGWRGVDGLLPRDAAYRRLRSLGATAVRLNVKWADVEPVPGNGGWELYDQAVDAARAAGLAPQLTLDGPAPAWATGDGRRGTVRPDPAAFGRFAGAAARHFAGRVRRFSIWNEPNWHGYLLPTREAASRYRRLYRRAAGAIRRADPAAEVLLGELAPMGRLEAATPPLRFLRAVTCSDRRWRARRRCVPLVADGVAHHPYTLRWAPEYPGPGRDDVTTGSLARLERALRRLRARGALRTPAGRTPSLFLTEWGYHADSRRVPEPLRSAYVARGLRIVAADPHVRQVVWYQLAGPPRSRTRIWDTALLDREGRPRPAFAAVRRWARRHALRRRAGG